MIRCLWLDMRITRSVQFTKTLPVTASTAPARPLGSRIALLGLGAVLVGTPMGADQLIVTWCAHDGWSW